MTGIWLFPLILNETKNRDIAKCAYLDFFYTVYGLNLIYATHVRVEINMPPR